MTKKDVLAYVEKRAPAAVAPWDTPSLGELFRPSEEVFGFGHHCREGGAV